MTCFEQDNFIVINLKRQFRHPIRKSTYQHWIPRSHGTAQILTLNYTTSKMRWKFSLDLKAKMKMPLYLLFQAIYHMQHQ